jgi:Flp pilus assembly protein TadG
MYRRNSNRSGVGLVYSIIAMSVLLLICSFAVDYGRVQMAKTQLRTAVDAAALAAAGDLPNGTNKVIATAIEFASRNDCENTSVIITDKDIKLGTWNSTNRKFTELHGINRSSANAVQISTSREVAAPFAQIYGGGACTVTAKATALYRPGRFAAVGLEFIDMDGNSTDSYSSSGNVVSPYLGSIASNGNIKLTGNSFVQGDAHPGVGKTVIGANRVSGNTSPLPEPLNMPATDPGTIRTINDNGMIPTWARETDGSIKLKASEVLTLHPGNYYIKDLDLTAGSILKVTGPVSLYIWGAIEMHGHAEVASNLPKNLKLITVKGPNGENPGTVTLNSGTAIYGELYAPLSPVIYKGSGSMYGSLVGKSIYMTGNSQLHYDVTLKGGISLVQ